MLGWSPCPDAGSQCAPQPPPRCCPSLPRRSPGLLRGVGGAAGRSCATLYGLRSLSCSGSGHPLQQPPRQQQQHRRSRPAAAAGSPVVACWRASRAWPMLWSICSPCLCWVRDAAGPADASTPQPSLAVLLPPVCERRGPPPLCCCRAGAALWALARPAAFDWFDKAAITPALAVTMLGEGLPPGGSLHVPACGTLLPSSLGPGPATPCRCACDFPALCLHAHNRSPRQALRQASSR